MVCNSIFGIGIYVIYIKPDVYPAYSLKIGRIGLATSDL